MNREKKGSAKPGPKKRDRGTAAAGHGGGTAAYLFHEGTNYTAYDYLGAHPVKNGAIFRVWAPNAAAVSVVGDFNGWSAEAGQMARVTQNGVWELTVSGLKRYDVYKFAVTGASGKTVLKADPYAFHAETRPGTGSKYYDLEGCHDWGDGEWMKRRAAADIFRAPMNIYEADAGSWRRYPDGNPYSYEKLTAELLPYVKKMGYTHVELMPLAEYPLDMSWGYQTTGYFAPTSRYGTPADLMAFVDACHRAGVGVIMDWVGAHFPKDEFALADFDGGSCYEYADPLKRESPDWGTCYFDYGRNEVASFLISNADYWLEKYHLDGLRVDAVSAMLYLDYGRKEWRPNKDGGRENLEAVALLRNMNDHIRKKFPGAITIAEESTAFPLVTAGTAEGGLGFSFKWNMGWMHDALDYMETDPYFRKFQHNKLTFSLTYAFSENYILPISHDEVVHGKRSLLDKMPGDYRQKFANTRLFMAYMMTHPGKKLMFMGCEYGPFREWDYASGLEWFMTDYEAHKKLSDYKAALDDFYLQHRELWELEHGWQGFHWLVADDADYNVIAYSRLDEAGDELVCVFNFSAVARENYRIGVSGKGLEPIFDSDDERWYGSATPLSVSPAEDVPAGGCPRSVKLTLPPLSAVFYKPIKGADAQ